MIEITFQIFKESPIKVERHTRSNESEETQEKNQ